MVDYSGMTLPEQTRAGLTSMFTQGQGASTAGGLSLAQMRDLFSQAGGIYGQMAGYQPQDVKAGQLSETDLKPYMNPFTKSVIDSTVGDLNRQEKMEQLGIAGQAQDQGAFGGDRFAIQQAEMNNNFDKVRSDAISKLYSGNFEQAQRAAQQDISGRLGADTANQNTRAGMSTTGARGLSDLSGQAGQLGSTLTGQGLGATAGGVNQGWDMYKDINGQTAASGGIIDQINQSLINAGKGQYGGYTGAPTSGLEYLMRSTSGLPSGIGTTTQTTPGTKGPMSSIGGGLSTLGSIGMK